MQTDVVASVQFADKSARELILEASLNEEKKKSKQWQNQSEEEDKQLQNLKESLKKMELENSSLQMQASTAGETVKRLMTENKDSIHTINMLKIEQESYIKTKEELSSKIQDIDKEKKLIQDECEKRIKFAEERAEQKSQKYESRALQEVKYKQELEQAMQKKLIDDKEEELNYLKEKCNKLEAENISLNSSNKAKLDVDSKIQELQSENYMLQLRIKDAVKKEDKEGDPEAKKIGNKEDKKDKIISKLKKEIETQEDLIKGFQKENDKRLEEIKEQKNKIKEMERLVYKENIRMREEQHKIVKENDKVMVVDNSQTVGIDTWNKLGHSNVITVGELKALKLQIDMLQMENKKLEEKAKNAEQNAQADVAVLLQQKQEYEEKFGTGLEIISKEKDTKSEQKINQNLEQKYKKEMNELEEKIQMLTISKDQQIKEKDAEIAELQEKVKEKPGSSLEQLLKQKDTEIETLQKKIKDKPVPGKNETTKKSVVALPASKAISDKIEEEYKHKIKLLENQIKEQKQRLKDAEASVRSSTKSAEITKSSDQENFSQILKKMLTSAEGSLLTKLFKKIQKLKGAIKTKNQGELKMFTKEIIKIFEKITPTNKNYKLFTQLMDQMTIFDKVINTSDKKATSDKMAPSKESNTDRAIRILEEMEQKLLLEIR